MTRWKKSKILIIACVIAVLLMIFVNVYIEKVRVKLWEKSVTDILEITTQGQKKLDTSLSKDFETIENLVKSLQELNSSDSEQIIEYVQVVEREEDISFLIINPNNEQYFKAKEIRPISFEYKDDLLNFTGKGISEFYYDQDTGLKVISLYENFTYRDGSRGIVMKQIPYANMVENFTLSFYDNSGFSYITKTDGTILIRSNHKNSNRTFQKISDIVDYEGNSNEVATKFYESLGKKESGIAVLSNQEEDNVFCYLPVDNTEDWYLISIIPKSIIDKQADEIIQSSLFLSLGVIVTIAIILLIYLRESHHHHLEIQNMAYYDKLTGLYSFERFKDLGNATLKNCNKKIASLYVDIHGFKAINDISGYENGDHLLCQIANTIKSLINKESYAARISADNFVILFLYDNELELDRFLQELTIKVDEISNICIKIGVCKDSEKVNTINQLIDRSRIAHRIAKNDKQDIVYYTQKMRDTMIEEAKIEARMEDALKNHEFVVYLQPQYDVNKARIRGAEALVRWQLANRIIYYPDEFIPLFERNGFVVKLDTYVFEQVCIFLHNRIENNLEVVPISVNVSRLHFFNENFVANFKLIKDKYGIPDGLLTLKITESVLAEQLEQMIAVAVALHKAGFLLAIDDFGSGYSSLNVLKDIPVDTVKMDRVFFETVKNTNKTEKSEIIINNIIRMTKELNIHNVAEGVETQEQLSFLKQVGCNLIQGYIFAKAVPIEEFIALMKKQ